MEWIEGGGRFALGIARQVLTPTSSIYWVYLLSALLVTILVLAIRARPFSALRVASALFPRRIYLHESVRHDLAIFVLNTILYTLVLVGPIQGISTWTAGVVLDALARLTPPEMPIDGVAWRGGLALAALVVADLAFFLSHYAQHRIPFLWSFHKVHHSARVLTPLTVFRRHPVDVVLERGLASAMLGALYGVSAWASRGQLVPLEILGQNAFAFLLLAAAFNLQHSHVWLRFGPFERVLVSPAMHQVHHSVAVAHHDRNFGNLLSIWDAMAKTRYLPSDRERLRFGLGGEDRKALGGLLRLYVIPFADAAKSFARVVRRQ